MIKKIQTYTRMIFLALSSILLFFDNYGQADQVYREIIMSSLYNERLGSRKFCCIFVILETISRKCKEHFAGQKSREPIFADAAKNQGQP